MVKTTIQKRTGCYFRFAKKLPVLFLVWLKKARAFCVLDLSLFLEGVLAHTAHGTNPVLGQVFKSCAGDHSVGAFRRVINIAANCAFPLIHGTAWFLKHTPINQEFSPPSF
jgi:hypothetical protein